MSRRKGRRQTMFWVIDQIMSDGEERTAANIRDLYEVFPTDRGNYRKHTPLVGEIRGKLQTNKQYEKKKRRKGNIMEEKGNILYRVTVFKANGSVWTKNYDNEEKLFEVLPYIF